MRSFLVSCFYEYLFDNQQSFKRSHLPELGGEEDLEEASNSEKNSFCFNGLLPTTKIFNIFYDRSMHKNISQLASCYISFRMLALQKCSAASAGIYS